ncbi:MAG: hypothetical protein MH204_04535 [Fimbriimonadaceae bacterium]|nr:hypothetical protein [Fimbriimonadaceae bacterium]
MSNSKQARFSSASLIAALFCVIIAAGYGHIVAGASWVLGGYATAWTLVQWWLVPATRTGQLPTDPKSLGHAALVSCGFWITLGVGFLWGSGAGSTNWNLWSVLYLGLFSLLPLALVVVATATVSGVLVRLSKIVR